MNKLPTIRVVSLFSGCGGGDLGLQGGFEFLGKKYKKLPYKFVWANDSYDLAVNTYRQNFKHPISNEDIKLIDINQIPDHDLLIGGFPCQTFSMVGQRKGFGDARGKLYLEMVRILEAKKPKIFIGENVKGLISVQKGKVFNKMLEDFETAGYKLYHKVLNAADYGVPQKRQRVLIIGIRKDIDLSFKFPDPLGDIVPLKRVLEDEKDVQDKYLFSQRAVEGLKKANKAFNKGRAQNIDLPCNTISTHLAKVSLNGTDPVLSLGKDKYRRITPKEAARIQSFPENFKFVGSDAHQYIQIGNAIAPVFMWYIGNAIAKQLFSYGRIHKGKKKRDNVENKVEEHLDRDESVPLFGT
jgi:DNA (cytosine-5)-methyltransferase 1